MKPSGTSCASITVRPISSRPCDRAPARRPRSTSLPRSGSREAGARRVEPNVNRRAASPCPAILLGFSAGAAPARALHRPACGRQRLGSPRAVVESGGLAAGGGRRVRIDSVGPHDLAIEIVVDADHLRGRSVLAALISLLAGLAQRRRAIDEFGAFAAKTDEPSSTTAEDRQLHPLERLDLHCHCSTGMRRARRAKRVIPARILTK